MNPKPFENYKRPSNLGLILWAIGLILLALICLGILGAIVLLCQKGCL